MEIKLIEARIYEAMVNKVEAFVEKVETFCRESEDKALKKWLDNQDVCDILNISKRTLQTYRDKGVLPFSCIRHKIFYKPEDVEKLLQETRQTNTLEK